jgi:hypothetical protein
MARFFYKFMMAALLGGRAFWYPTPSMKGAVIEYDTCCGDRNTAQGEAP